MKIQEKSKIKTKKYKSTNPFKINWNGVPATARYSLAEAYLIESVMVSVSWHILGVLLFSIIAFALSYFGLTHKLFPTPVTKTPDIEFSINSHSIHHYRSSASRQSATAQKIVSPQTTNTPAQNNTIPTAKSSASKSSVPEFAIPMPKISGISSGLGSSGKSRHHSSGSSSGGPSIGDIEGAFSAGSGTSGSSGFNKTAIKNVIATYDISPYVNELKRNIRWNWKPVSGSEGKRVELFLRIAKDGKIVILNVKKTSESGDVDNAALNAVRKSSPLNPLPSQYKKSYLDVVFTFSNNSVGSRY